MLVLGVPVDIFNLPKPVAQVTACAFGAGARMVVVRDVATRWPRSMGEGDITNGLVKGVAVIECFDQDHANHSITDVEPRLPSRPMQTTPARSFPALPRFSQAGAKRPKHPCGSVSAWNRDERKV